MSRVFLPGLKLDPGARRARLLDAYRVDLVIDVGANAGQYGARLRESGYDGRIASFEPAAAPFARLRRRAAADPRWECRRLALGDARACAALNISSDDRASSLLAVMERHVAAAPESAFVAREEVEVEPLDGVWDEIRADRPYLKIDVQGGELAVLQGGREVLDHCVLVEVELSLVPLYESGPLFPDVLDWLRAREFAPVAFECVLDEPRTGEMLQLDGIFRRGSRSGGRRRSGR